MNDALEDNPFPPSSRIRRPVGLGETVYDNLLNRLMSLQIAPGTRINIDTMAREMGASPIPIREALAPIEEQGLVVKTHNIGFSAAPQIDLNRFEDIYDLRLQLEPEGAARAAQAMTDADATAIAELAQSMEGSGPQDARSSHSRFATIDAAFHDRILRVAGNALICEALARLHVHMHLFRLHYNALVTTSAVEEHRALLGALLARDSHAARAAMRHHIQLSRARFLVTFSRQSPP